CDLGPGRGIVAAVLHLEATRFLADLAGMGSEQRRLVGEAAGLKTMVGVPVSANGQVVAVLEFLAETEVPADDKVADALRAVSRRAPRPAHPPVRPAQLPKQTLGKLDRLVGPDSEPPAARAAG